MRVNLGAGSTLKEGWINQDVVPLPGITAVFDLDNGKWPWLDGEVEEIEAFDIFEHVARPLYFMSECHRVLRVGGQLRIHTSYWKTENSYSDPTHRRFCTEHTFDYWVPGTHFNNRYGPAYAQGCHFRYVTEPHTDGQELNVVLEKI